MVEQGGEVFLDAVELASKALDAVASRKVRVLVVGNPARAEFTFFGLEGDKQLGVPPQDNPNDPGGYCPTCEDFIKFNGQRLSNETNPPGNIWNSTLPDGSTGLGVDIDAFNVGAGGLNLVRPGDTTATIQPGVGDGVGVGATVPNSGATAVPLPSQRM